MYCSAGGIVLVFVQKKYIYFQEKIAKNIPARAALFGSNVTNSFVGWGFNSPQTPLGEITAPPDT